MVGTAIEDSSFTQNNSELLDLVVREFNVITPENEMKWVRVHPMEKEWCFEAGNRLVEFGQKNNLNIQGHVLVWHSQVPLDLFVDESGKQISKGGLMKKMEPHIQTIVGRYKGKILSWDVVNESITPMSSERASGLKLWGLNFWNWHFI